MTSSIPLQPFAQKKKIKSSKVPKPRIALLYSESTKDSNEQTYGTHCPKALEAAGCDVIELDYHKCGIKLTDEKIAAQHKAGELEKPTLDNTYAMAFGTQFDFINDDAKRRKLAQYFFEQTLDAHISNWFEKHKIDGFFAPGNHYNVVPPNVNGDTDRADIERACIRVILKKKMPSLHICGGMQRFIHTIGGQIDPDIAKTVGSDVHQGKFDKTQHRIELQNNTNLKRKYEVRFRSRPPQEQFIAEFKSSEHSQGVVKSDELETVLQKWGLRIAALDATDNPQQKNRVVEAIEGDGILLTQYHPETGTEVSVELESFAAAAAKYHLRTYKASSAQR